MLDPKFVSAFRSEPARSGFFFDFDGTLSEVVDQPSLAKPVDGGPELLRALSETYAHVALVSGRRATDLANLVGVEGIHYHGLYGAEWLTAGRLQQPEEAQMWRGMASRLARDAEVLIATEGLTGCEVDFKDLATSVHYRNSPERERARSVLLEWAEIAGPRRRFVAGEGRMVVELRPIGISKASTTAKLIGEWNLAHLVAAGDDTADVAALKRAKELLKDQALCIGVLSDESPDGLSEVADHLVGSPYEMLEVLRSFV